MDTGPQKASVMPTNSAESPRISHAKYVFTDIVGFARNRDIDAQVGILLALTEIVQSAVDKWVPQDDSRIFLPTGDGFCIAILDYKTIADPEMRIALELLQRIATRNANATNNPRFELHVRIGINQGLDRLIRDINGRWNLVGI